MTDDSVAADWVDGVRALPSGSAVIVRHRNGIAREELARRLLVVCRARQVKVLVADDIALGVRLRADGIHLPQRHVHRARQARMFNRGFLITGSAHNLAEFAHAVRCGVDAVFVSPVYATGSHAGGKVLGVSGVASIIRSQRKAAYALGGIDADNCEQLAMLPLCGLGLIRGWL